MLTHFTRSVRQTFDRLSSSCGLNKINACILKSKGATSNFGTSTQWRKYIGTRPENSGVGTDNEDQFRRSQKDSFTDSIHFEHSAFGLLGWSTALALGWCMSQTFFRKCILPSERSKWDRTSVSQNLANTVFAQPSVGINKENSIRAYDVANSTFAQSGAGVNKTDIYVAQTASESHSVDNTTFNAQTAKEALQKAVDDFAQIQNGLTAAVDNTLGVKHMKLGQKDIALAQFRKSVKLGNSASMFNMGICYEMGVGVEKDLTQAAGYYAMAAKKGHPTAIYNLGIFYMYGLGGVPRHLTYAQELFKCAASLGQKEAKEAYDKLSSYLERRERLKQRTNSPACGSSGMQGSGALLDTKAVLLKERLSDDVLNHKSKLNDLLVAASNTQESWTQDLINIVTTHKPR